ncbi:MAG TPA: class I SAM-dependent methyltransferase, partial [Fimbriimonadaceae bacterium]|nr:class I SAM-dependent methyltransferase [Fimbriimonadaceae bacterium]
CQPMLDLARKKFPGVRLVLADAGRLPIRDGTFDGATVGWGLRNLPDVSVALREIARVLKPGGRFVTLDMARPRIPIVGRISEATCHTIVPLIGRMFGKSEAYTYLPKSAAVFMSREEMRSAMEQAGFQDVRWRDLYFGNVCMHWGVKA